jgi:hypothetical protein
VPIPPSKCEVVAHDIEPAVVRIGPDRTLLDPPWGLWPYRVAHVWPDRSTSGGWARRTWPEDAWSHRPIAPQDLHLGHVLEFASRSGSRVAVQYAWVAEVDDRRMVVVPCASAIDAVGAAARAVEIWRAAEIGDVERVWRERMAAAQRFYESP